MAGWFRLETSHDLLKKLVAEAQEIHQDPINSRVAFNLVVTGWHLLEWTYPGNAKKKQRDAVRHREILLQVLEHLANGVKHFKLDAQQHQSVKATGGAPSWARGPNFGRQIGRRIINRRMLYVQLDGAAAKHFGEFWAVTDLANQVVSFWQRHLARVGAPAMARGAASSSRSSGR